MSIAALNESSLSAQWTNREVRHKALATRSVRFAAVKTPQSDPLAETVVLPQDELALRRLRKELDELTPAQIYALAEAVELLEKTAEGERDE